MIITYLSIPLSIPGYNIYIYIFIYTCTNVPVEYIIDSFNQNTTSSMNSPKNTEYEVATRKKSSYKKNSVTPRVG